MDAELVAVLTEETHLPAEALKRAARNPETVAEPVLALLERAAEDADAIEDEETNLLFWGLHALAAAPKVGAQAARQTAAPRRYHVPSLPPLAARGVAGALLPSQQPPLPLGQRTPW